jgi:hypothetical protein
MFAGFAPAQRLWLLLLLAVWAAFLFGGFVFGRPDARHTRRMPAWTRMASSLGLVIAGWSWFWFSRSTSASAFALLLALGMTFGFLGDLFMARLLPVTQPVLGGMASFGLGHIAYVAGILAFSHRHGLDVPGPRWGAWIAWLLFGLAGWYVVAGRCQRPRTALRWAALPYSLLLASTAGLASGLALQAPTFFTLAAGGALFLLSDLILAARLFGNAYFPLLDDVVWLTYGPGQMLIVYSAGSALSLG